MLVLLRFAAVNRHPARLHQDLAFGLERFLHHARDAGRHHRFRGGKEDSKEALRDHVVELGLDLVEVLGLVWRGNNGKVVGDFGVVENALVRLHPFLLQDLVREHSILRVHERFQRAVHRRDIVLGQGARISSRIGKHLVPFVKGLRDLQSRGRGKSEAGVGVALQAGQIIQQRRKTCGRFALLGDDAGLAFAFGADRFGFGLVPNAFGTEVGTLVLLGLLEILVEPAADVFASLGTERTQHFPIILEDEALNLFFAIDHDGEGRGLHATDGGEKEPAALRIERGHCACDIDADQPIGLGAGYRGVGQRQKFAVFTQGLETVAD